jgi:FkbM family methyltransferase
MRKTLLKLLKKLRFNFKIKHHYTGYRFLLNSYFHKGYWFHGKNREFNTVQNFVQLINKGDYIVEVGGHIGYFSTLFAKLTGATGKVVVFEPSSDNLMYLNYNVKLLPLDLQNIITIVPKGVGDKCGDLTFYIDPITGQNNSFVENFEGFFQNRKNSGDPRATLTKTLVNVVTLDSIFEKSVAPPNFIKIDVEGFELNVVMGMRKLISKYSPTLMIEIQKDQENILDFFYSFGYQIYNDEMLEIRSFSEYLNLKTPNLFFKKGS